MNIETDRLLIRPFTSEDIDTSYEMNLDLKVSSFTGDGGIVYLNEIKRRILDNVLDDYKNTVLEDLQLS